MDPVEESTGSTIPPPKKDPAPVAPPPNTLKSPFPSPALEASEDLVGEGPKLKKLILITMSSANLKLFNKLNLLLFNPQNLNKALLNAINF